MDCICLCYYSLSSLERKSRYFLFYLVCFMCFKELQLEGLMSSLHKNSSSFDLLQVEQE